MYTLSIKRPYLESDISNDGSERRLLLGVEFSGWFEGGGMILL
jgi:hypothetical protein